MFILHLKAHPERRFGVMTVLFSSGPGEVHDSHSHPSGETFKPDNPPPHINRLSHLQGR